MPVHGGNLWMHCTTLWTRMTTHHFQTTPRTIRPQNTWLILISSHSGLHQYFSRLLFCLSSFPSCTGNMPPNIGVLLCPFALLCLSSNPPFCDTSIGLHFPTLLYNGIAQNGPIVMWGDASQWMPHCGMSAATNQILSWIVHCQAPLDWYIFHLLLHYLLFTAPLVSCSVVCAFVGLVARKIGLILTIKWHEHYVTLLLSLCCLFLTCCQGVLLSHHHNCNSHSIYWIGMSCIWHVFYPGHWTKSNRILPIIIFDQCKSNEDIPKIPLWWTKFGSASI